MVPCVPLCACLEVCACGHTPVCAHLCAQVCACTRVGLTVHAPPRKVHQVKRHGSKAGEVTNSESKKG